MSSSTFECEKYEQKIKFHLNASICFRNKLKSKCIVLRCFKRPPRSDAEIVQLCCYLFAQSVGGTRRYSQYVRIYVSISCFLFGLFIQFESPITQFPSAANGAGSTWLACSCTNCFILLEIIDCFIHIPTLIIIN